MTPANGVADSPKRDGMDFPAGMSIFATLKKPRQGIFRAVPVFILPWPTRST